MLKRPRPASWLSIKCLVAKPRPKSETSDDCTSPANIDTPVAVVPGVPVLPVTVRDGSAIREGSAICEGGTVGGVRDNIGNNGDHDYVFADAETVIAYSSVARAMFSVVDDSQAAETPTVFDVSEMRLEGGAVVTRKVVIAWLNAVYVDMHGAPHSPDVGTPTNPSDICDLLSFADAIGCTRGALACMFDASVVSALAFEVNHSKNLVKTMKMNMDGRRFYYDAKAAAITDAITSKAVISPCSPVYADLIRRALARRLEALLYLSLRMRLPAITHAALDFLRANMTAGRADQEALFPGGIANDLVYSTVFSGRVVATCMPPTALDKRAFVADLLASRLSESVALGKNVGAIAFEEAVTLRNFVGFPKGTTGRCVLKLDGSSLRLKGLFGGKPLVVPVELRVAFHEPPSDLV